MGKKAVNLLLIMVTISLCLCPAAFAARSLLSPIDDLVMRINTNPDLGLPEVRDNPTIWALSVFTIIFAILYAGSSFVPVFKEQRGPRIAFSAAFAILSIFVPGPIAIISGLGVVALIIFLLLAIFFIFFTAGRDFLTGFTEAGTRGHRAAADSASARREREEAERELRRLRDERYGERAATRKEAAGEAEELPEGRRHPGREPGLPKEAEATAHERKPHKPEEHERYETSILKKSRSTLSESLRLAEYEKMLDLEAEACIKSMIDYLRKKDYDDFLRETDMWRRLIEKREIINKEIKEKLKEVEKHLPRGLRKDVEPRLNHVISTSVLIENSDKKVNESFAKFIKDGKDEAGKITLGARGNTRIFDDILRRAETYLRTSKKSSDKTDYIREIEVMLE